VKREGLLLRASPDATVVRWEGGLYGFLNEEEAEMFSANPAEYLAALIHVRSNRPKQNNYKTTVSLWSLMK
jgi:hypothetical protein